MGWKDLSYWLKGGLLVSLTYCILSILLFSKIMSSMTWTFYYFLSNPIYWIYSYLLKINDPLWQIIKFNPESPMSLYFYYLIVGIIFYFISGAIIGWIYGKIKDKSSKQTN